MAATTACAAIGLWPPAPPTWVAFGQTFIANPDLPERFRADAALNPPDPATFYGGDSRGYTDYPALDAA